MFFESAAGPNVVSCPQAHVIDQQSWRMQHLADQRHLAMPRVSLVRW
ncbi:hypothetical protein [Alloactinosynnema sp. L-07]|nr:hypothetical protein [Alloactinosynnema sp. L-07]